VTDTHYTHTYIHTHKFTAQEHPYMPTTNPTNTHPNPTHTHTHPQTP